MWRDDHVISQGVCSELISYDGGEAGNLHPGLLKIPPRLLENPTQGSGKLQNLHKPCDYTFLDKQVSEEKFKKWPRYVELNWTIFMNVQKKIQFIYWNNQMFVEKFSNT